MKDSTIILRLKNNWYNYMYSCVWN